MPESLWPFGLFVLLTIGTFGGMLLSSWVLGERRPREGALPYESGLASTGAAHVRNAPHFYLIALLFVVFDVEGAFLFAWAVVVRETGWPGFLEVSFFVAVLLASLVWLWRIGALDWGSKVRKIRHPPPTRRIVAAPPPTPER